MTRRLLASALAASLALTTFVAAPARAQDSGEIGRFLLGAGALFIIGSAISNNNRNASNNGHSHNTHHHGTVTRRGADPVYRVAPRRVVPSACLRVNKWDNGPRRFFDQRCLNNNMYYVDRLPGNCLRTIRTHNGRRTVYAAHCLRNNGWIFG